MNAKKKASSSRSTANAKKAAKKAPAKKPAKKVAAKKKVSAKKAPAKKAPAKKAAPKAAVKKKAAAKKAAVKKPAAKKPTAKKAVKKAAAKKPVKTAKKAAAKKTPTKKPAAKKAAPAKVAKKAPVKKAAKKAPVKAAGKKPAKATAAKQVAKLAGPAVSPPALKPTKRGAAITGQDAEKFRLLLVAIRARLRGDVSAMSREALGSQGSSENHAPIHPAEVGTHSFEQEFTLNLLSSDSEHLDRIEAALAKISEGTYGLCEECDGRIPKARLEVIPDTQYCVKCASKLEG